MSSRGGIRKKREAWAAQTLGDIGKPARKALPELRIALKDPDINVRIAAAEAIKKIESDPDN